MAEYTIWKSKKPLLSHLDIELTERCNNNCIHCYINRKKDDPVQKSEMTTNEIMAVLDQAALLGCINVMFTGGEPLLRKDFEELYVYTRKLGMTVTLKTNATLISPHLASVFARIPPKEPIIITIYGTNKSTYEAATQTPGSFDAFMNGIYLLVKNKVHFLLSCMITRNNINEVDSYKSWSLMALDEEMEISYGLTIDLSARRDNSRNNILRHLRIPSEDIMRIRNQNINNYYDELKIFCKKFLPGPSGNVIFSCGSCIHSCTMDAYGNLQPCLLLRHPDIIYNLKNGSIKEAMTEFFPKIREARATNEAYLSRCARCFLQGLCNQCPAKSWMEHGTLDTPVDYLCELAHLEAINLGLLHNGEKAWDVEDWRERINSL